VDVWSARIRNASTGAGKSTREWDLAVLLTGRNTGAIARKRYSTRTRAMSTMHWQKPWRKDGDSYLGVLIHK